MDPSPKASSLYGPGAFVGWLCTAVSVFISWIFNRQSKARDTIGNDLIATLTIPSIAAIHHHYELHKMKKNSTEPAMETLIPTLCIAVWFAVTGPWLVCLAAVYGRPKRCICNGIVLVLCVSVLFAIPPWQDQLRKLPVVTGFGNIMSPCIFYGWFILLLPILACIPSRLWIGLKPQSPDRRACSKDRTVYISRGTGALCLLFLAVLVLVVVAGAVFLGRSGALRDGEAQHLTLSERFGVPQTEYSITELDQAVAMSAGLLAIVFAAYEAYSSRTRSAWERYQEWRARCEDLLEEGVMEVNEASKWRERLREMVQHEKEMLSAPTGTGVLAALERRKKERDEEARKAEEERYSNGEMSEGERWEYELRQWMEG